MKETILITLVIFATIFLILTNLHLIFQQLNFQSSLQIIKNQLNQAEKALVNIPQPDYTLAIILSICSLIIGIGIGIISRK